MERPAAARSAVCYASGAHYVHPLESTTGWSKEVAAVGTVASLLADHVSFRLSCVDRLFVQGYVPGLQSEGLVVRFLLHQGLEIP